MARPDRIKITKLKADFVDKRGSVTHILKNGSMRRITMVYSTKGSVRGNHYHKRTAHYVYVVDGKLQFVFVTKGVKSRKNLKPGCLVWIPPGEPHAFVALEDSKAIEMAPTDYGPEDAYRLDEPLV